jgi:hypothetical protein
MDVDQEVDAGLEVPHAVKRQTKSTSPIWRSTREKKSLRMLLANSERFAMFSFPKIPSKEAHADLDLLRLRTTEMRKRPATA